jgi:hypothetical protein
VSGARGSKAGFPDGPTWGTGLSHTASWVEGSILGRTAILGAKHAVILCEPCPQCTTPPF